MGLTLISVAVGLGLAVAYHLLFMRFQVWVARRSSVMAPAITVLGFLVRLTVVAVILVALSLWTSLNILAVGLSFVVLFTILNGYSLYSLTSKRKSAPPSTGATGAHQE